MFGGRGEARRAAAASSSGGASSSGDNVVRRSSSSGDRDDRDNAIIAADVPGDVGDVPGDVDPPADVRDVPPVPDVSMEGVVRLGDELSHQTQQELDELNSLFEGLRDMMQTFVRKYGSNPGDDAIYEHLRHAHEDLQAKLVMAATMPPVARTAVSLPIVVVDVPDVRDRVDVPDVPDGSLHGLAVPDDGSLHGDGPAVPDVSDIASGEAVSDVPGDPSAGDAISLSSENTTFYPEDVFLE